ncbi:FMN reductase [Streptomyces sp. CHA1]|uniref:FMN reductase n=1 Tax=Streptomyces TaxID=1883 RepID=UPI0003C2D25A|nr:MULTISPECIES: FMN reductase [Streptomyces]QPA00775.1 oxidoreductase [Streptomyces violascens]ESP98492.1 FMN reductase [Streptomyces sp. GBA 94-10 4N24]ESQ04133.1 FMN reductase [Streptomyces sp. PVA_94-07]MBT3160044.1 FMN reductase [Streptomyces sp. G11C]MCO6702189.1 FMN reductase [Streptomyces sp. CHB9.2]
MTEFPLQSGERPAAEAPDGLADDPRHSAEEPVSRSGPLRVVVVSAGLSVPSSTRLLADRLGEAAARDLGAAEVPVRVDTVELRDLAGDIAQNFTAGFPGPKLAAALDQVTGADAVIAVTPIFTASYSGLFKSFFDVLDQEALTGKPVLIAATGGTARHSLALEHALRPLFAYLRAVVVPTAVYAASEDWGNTDGLNRRIDRAAAELAALLAGTGGRRAAPAADPLEEVVPFAEQLAALRVQE